MNAQEFISNYREAFGDKAALPICFGYSDGIIGEPMQTRGCIFKCFDAVRAGKSLCASRETLSCGGGKLYTGFAPMPDHVPGFVSTKERYKQTPEMVSEYIRDLEILPAAKPYLWFTRIDQAMPDTEAEGILFIATPDQLAGLVTWACFDNNAPDAVSTPFGSGCCSTLTLTVKENRCGGRRTFLGLFDPSARPYFKADELVFAVPMSRFREMCTTMRDSCLFGPPAWQKLKKRINGEPID